MRTRREYVYEEYPVESDTVAGSGFEAVIYPRKHARFGRWEIHEGGDVFYVRSVLFALHEQIADERVREEGIPAITLHSIEGERSPLILPSVGPLDRIVLLLQNKSERRAKFRSTFVTIVRRDDVTAHNAARIKEVWH